MDACIIIYVSSINIGTAMMHVTESLADNSTVSEVNTESSTTVSEVTTEFNATISETTTESVSLEHSGDA